MRHLDDDVVFATGDLTRFVRCRHASMLDHGVGRGTITPLATRPISAMTELIVDKGQEHERRYVDSLRATGQSIVSIDKPAWTIEQLRDAEATTLAAMKSGVQYIDQAAFFDGRWSGFADLLERVDRPSPTLGRWSYEVVDTKLARATKAHFILQLSDYSSHLARLQGCAAESMHVVLGTGERATFRVEDFAAYYRHVRGSLEHSYLFVQGPPGSGKTYNGARAIVALLRAGRRIGVTSSSHKAIHNLLDEVERVAHAEGYRFRGLKKCSDDDSKFVSKLADPMIGSTKENDDCADPAIQLAAGTAWSICDEALAQSLDYLFIDEAGQVSLANTIAMSTAARNLVLLGDPLQLAQVSQGSHPDGVGASVLEHLLGAHATIPPDRGIFLEHTWRMHPDVCGFVSDIVYDSRLRAADECATQRITIDGIAQTGLRFLAVAHSGNSQSSDEEAVRVASEIRRMLHGGTFTNAKGQTAALRPADFLVVAAYNAQVRHLTRELADAGLHDVPVGTVDKFQGKEAPIVFFSMATSSGADLPRNIDFLFSRNRLNVAISRARCLAVIVASPQLLDVACKTPDEMRLVNALCRFVELAGRG